MLQDFTGVPAVVDLAAMRDAVARAGGDPERINPAGARRSRDRSLRAGRRLRVTPRAFAENVAREHERNRERYLLLRWGQKAFKNFRVVPPGTGIVHQVNLEFLASVVDVRAEGGATFAFPDTLVGTDSHTTMINGLGVLGWGVGGIEAEAVLLGQPLYQLLPIVVGCRLTGQLRPGTTATDLVLTITQMLRKHGVVGKFVEFCGAGMRRPRARRPRHASPTWRPSTARPPGSSRSTTRPCAICARPAASRRASISSSATARSRASSAPRPRPSRPSPRSVTLDLATVEPSLAGPRRPQDRAPLGGVKASFRDRVREAARERPTAATPITSRRRGRAPLEPRRRRDRRDHELHQHVEPVGHARGRPARARRRSRAGSQPKPYVKTSLAPGSRVVTEYLRDAGLLESLDALGFDLVGYGCTTCIAAGTPVLMANGTARRIETLPSAAAARGLLSPDRRSHAGVGDCTPKPSTQGVRDCVALTFEDGRTLVCTPDHEICCADGRWVRADALALATTRGRWDSRRRSTSRARREAGYVLAPAISVFALDGPDERARTLGRSRACSAICSATVRSASWAKAG